MLNSLWDQQIFLKWRFYFTPHFKDTYKTWKFCYPCHFNRYCICGYLAHKKIVSVSCWPWKLLCTDLSFSFRCQLRTDWQMVGYGECSTESLRNSHGRLDNATYQTREWGKKSPTGRLERVSVHLLNPSSVVLGSWFVLKRIKCTCIYSSIKLIYFKCCGVHGVVQGLCGAQEMESSSRPRTVHSVVRGSHRCTHNAKDQCLAIFNESSSCVSSSGRCHLKCRRTN